MTRLLACLLALCLVPGAAAAADAPRRGGRIVFAMKGDAVQLNPVLASDYHSGTINHLLFDGLLRRVISSDTDETVAFAPLLAERVEERLKVAFTLGPPADGASLTPERALARIEEARRAEPGGALAAVAGVRRTGTAEVTVELSRMETGFPAILDRLLGRTLECRLMPMLIFTLRGDARWHDGEPVTAEDVKFTYDTIVSPSTQSPVRSNFALVESVEALDPRTVRATYSNYFAKYQEPWLTGILPRHILRGEDVNRSLFNRHPIGNGPFVFREWAVNDHILLDANREYYDGRPLIDQAVFRVIPDEAHMFLELLAGRIDVMQMKPDQFRKASMSRTFDEAFAMKRVLEPEYTYLGYNLVRPPFDDARVRRALTMAIDRDRLVTDILKGYGEVVSGPFYKDDWAYDKSVKPLPHDPPAARALLAEAGFRDVNGDGVLERDLGDRELELSFEVRTNSGNKDRELTARRLEEEFRAVGVRPRVVFEEWGRFVSRIDAKDFDAILLAWNLSFDPDDTLGVWHSREIPDPASGKFGLNAISYSHPEVDRLFDAARTMTDTAGRREAYHRIHRIIAEDQPYSFLYAAESLYAIRGVVKNAQVNKVRIVYDLKSWWVER